jgi:hypothetical protein
LSRLRMRGYIGPLHHAMEPAALRQPHKPGPSFCVQIETSSSLIFQFFISTAKFHYIVTAMWTIRVFVDYYINMRNRTVWILEMLRSWWVEFPPRDNIRCRAANCDPLRHGVTSGIVDTPVACCYVECNQVKVFPCCHLSLLVFLINVPSKRLPPQRRISVPFLYYSDIVVSD